MSSNNLSLGRVRMGGVVRRGFIFEKASSHFVVHSILSFFFQGSEEEESLITYTREEARQGDKATCKKLHFFDVGGACHIDDFLELIPIGLYAFLC